MKFREAGVERGPHEERLFHEATRQPECRLGESQELPMDLRS